MAILQPRPEIVFDPTNKEHRNFFYTFLEKGSWAGAPRFFLETPYLEVPAMIQRKLLDYYMKLDKEIK